MKKSAEAQFQIEMMALYDRCARAGFRPVLLRRLVVLKGGVGAARDIVFQSGMSGIDRLSPSERASLSMEALMLRPEYRAFFTDLELKEAARRLAGGTPDRARGRLEARTIQMTQPR